jgi:hypothetical protein
VLLLLGSDRGQRKEQLWQSQSTESPNDTETPSLSMT